MQIDFLLTVKIMTPQTKENIVLVGVILSLFVLIFAFVVELGIFLSNMQQDYNSPCAHMIGQDPFNTDCPR